jgi:hypothetical protein
VYRQIGPFRQWLAETVRDSEPSAIIVTSHHDRNTVFFDSSDRVFSRQIERRFRLGSIAVLNGCGTGAPGATDIIAELNRRGVAAVIATGTEVRGEMAGWFLACFAEAVEGATGREPRLTELYFTAIQCLRSKRGQRAVADYGGYALAYLLMGNAGLTLCPPRKTP